MKNKEVSATVIRMQARRRGAAEHARGDTARNGGTQKVERDSRIDIPTAVFSYTADGVEGFTRVGLLGNLIMD